VDECHLKAKAIDGFPRNNANIKLIVCATLKLLELASHCFHRVELHLWRQSLGRMQVRSVEFRASYRSKNNVMCTLFLRSNTIDEEMYPNDSGQTPYR
jgi:hypothetical protein